jgi:hypothetical protein
MSKFKVGDRPWRAEVGNKQVAKPCPVCVGTKQVTLILGTGESCILPCEYCGKGYEGPRGEVQEYELFSGAVQVTVVEIRTSQTSLGEETEYIFGDHHVEKEDGLFSTREEAVAACAERCAKLDEEHRTRAEYIKKNQAKSYSWNAGYHLREAKQEEESAARHRERAILCKAKAKEDR